MLTLRLLGGLALDNPDNAPLGRAGQRRRLALLAILGSRTGTAFPREKLLGLLWPEVPREDARHRLSAALYDLRAALGADAVAVTPDDAALASGALSIDVIDFENAVRCGDFAKAVSLYGGPFLDGVYLVDAPEFERWVDLRRASLQRTFANALERLALRLGEAGQTGEALEAWRRLQELDPYSSRTTLGLMRALDAAGDRPSAVMQARAHAGLLRRELDADPDPAVERLALELKQRPAAAPEFIRDTSDVNPADAKARAEISVAPMTPSMHPEAIFEIRRGRRRLAIAVILSLGALSAMRLTRSGAAGSLRAESEAAGHAFNAADGHMRAGRFDAAVDAYSRAVSDDSAFALAHYKLAVATLWADQPGSNFDKHIEHALHLTDRLREVDGLMLRAFIEWRAGRANNAEALYRRVIALDSTSVEAWHQLGETYFHYNPIRGQPIGLARAPFEMAARLEPQHFGSLWHLAQLAALEHRTADVSSLTDRLLALRPDALRTLEVQLFRAAALADDVAFNREFERLRAADHSFLFGVGWRIAVFAHSRERAARVYELLTQADRPANVRTLGHSQLIYLDVAGGQPTRAIARLRELRTVRLPGVIDPWMALLPGVVLANAGDEAELRVARNAMASRVEATADDSTHLAEQLAALAWADLTLGDTLAASARLRRMKVSAESRPALSEYFTAEAGAYVLGGRGHLPMQARRAQRALRTIDQAFTPRWFGNAAADYSIAHSVERFVRARALVALGRPAEAEAWLAGLETHVSGDLALGVPALLMRANIAVERGDTALARGFCARADTAWVSGERTLRSHLRRRSRCTW
jgi:DNA-binding SARP family transcriptional activator